ncbi:hypothetical protein [Methylocystis sp. S23]
MPQGAVGAPFGLLGPIFPARLRIGEHPLAPGASPIPTIEAQPLLELRALLWRHRLDPLSAALDDVAFMRLPKFPAIEAQPLLELRALLWRHRLDPLSAALDDVVFMRLPKFPGGGAYFSHLLGIVAPRPGPGARLVSKRVGEFRVGRASLALALCARRETLRALSRLPTFVIPVLRPSLDRVANIAARIRSAPKRDFRCTNDAEARAAARGLAARARFNPLFDPQTVR